MNLAGEMVEVTLSDRRPPRTRDGTIVMPPKKRHKLESLRTVRAALIRKCIEVGYSTRDVASIFRISQSAVIKDARFEIPGRFLDPPEDDDDFDFDDE